MTIEIYKGKVVQAQNLGLYEGKLPVLVDELESLPPLRWHGAKIPARYWARIASFMRWTYAEFNSEAQLRLYYSPERNKWKAVPLPQYIGTGMFSGEIKDDPDRETVFARVPPDYLPAGTVHHHCSGSAFQSGIDHKDEVRQNGLHVTFGHVHNGKLDLDARATFRGINYGAELADWVEHLEEPPIVEFPRWWKATCKVKPPPKASPLRGIGFGAGNDYWSRYHGTGYGFNAGDTGYDDYLYSESSPGSRRDPELDEEALKIVAPVLTELNIELDPDDQPYLIDAVAEVADTANSLYLDGVQTSDLLYLAYRYALECGD